MNYIEGRASLLSSSFVSLLRVLYNLFSCRAYDEVEGAVAYAIPTRPISALVQRIEEIETVISRRQEEIRSEVDAVVVGGGAAGVELAFSLRARWEGKFGKIKVNVTLIAAEEKLFSEESVQVRDLHMKEIARR